MTAMREFDVVVIGAGPAGTAAALRAGDLGAKSALITCGAFGGMAANEGPIPVRVLAHAARLAREARFWWSAHEWSSARRAETPRCSRKKKTPASSSSSTPGL